MDDGIEAMMHEQPVQELRIGDVAGHRGEVDRAVGARDIEADHGAALARQTIGERTAEAATRAGD